MLDLIGLRVGRLRVFVKTDKRWSREVVWLCRCDCGADKYVKTSLLTSGGVKSCGCLRRENLASRAIDLSGRRFGRLVALESTDIREGSFVVWCCVCDCGNEKLVASRSLIGEKTRSCGCLVRDSAVDMVGLRFGRLVVTKKTKLRQGGSVVWECQCDCGNTSRVSGASLRNGAIRSCGCLQMDVARNNYIRLLGRKFGRLTVIEKTSKLKKECIVWRCQCDCGQEHYVASCELTYGSVRSCGCLHRDIVSARMMSDDGAHQIAKMHLVVRSNLKVSDLPRDLIESQALRIKINRKIREYDNAEY